jgi:hypothetical protein
VQVRQDVPGILDILSVLSSIDLERKSLLSVCISQIMGAKRKRALEEAPLQVGEPTSSASAEPVHTADQDTAQDGGEPYAELAQQLEEGILEILQARKPGATC